MCDVRFLFHFKHVTRFSAEAPPLCCRVDIKRNERKFIRWKTGSHKRVANARDCIETQLKEKSNKRIETRCERVCELYVYACMFFFFIHLYECVRGREKNKVRELVKQKEGQIRENLRCMGRCRGRGVV